MPRPRRTIKHSPPQHPRQQQEPQHSRQQQLDQPNPLLIPELLLIISKKFDRHTLLHCIIVCKSWYATLHSVLWSNLDLVVKGNQLIPSEKLYKKNASMVRKLQIHIVIQPIFG